MALKLKDADRRFVPAILAVAVSLAVTTRIYAQNVEPPKEASQSRLFQGHWEWCNGAKSEMCSNYNLLQRNGKICGVWYYWANGEYRGKIIGFYENGKLSVSHICGRAGSDTQTECVDDASWEKQDRHMLVCNDKLYDHGEWFDTTCVRANANAGFKRRQLNKIELAEMKGAAWVQKCLTDPNYPAAAIK